MAKSSRSFFESLPGGKKLVTLYKTVKFKVYFPFFKGKEALFTDYYERSIWGEPESYSGPGSTLKYTEPLRKELPKLLSTLEIKTLLDAPCGDFNWFKETKKELSLHYIGGDIVRPLVEENRTTHGDEKTMFIHLDITKDDLPKSDLWLCRDCWIHFSNSDIKKALSRFLESEIPYLLASTYTESSENVDIATGEHRFLNLELPPFNFPKPEVYLDDWIEGMPVKKLGLWKQENLERFLRELT